MYNLTHFDELAGPGHGIEAINPGMVARIRAQAAGLDPYQIAARLADAVTNAADAAHSRSWEESQFGDASPDAIVDQEYYEELASAWSLVAIEHQLISPETIMAHHASLH